jgi:hypothetical protein
VTAVDAIFTFTGQPSVACGDLETAGENGQIPIDNCAFLPQLVSVCECDVAPTPAPVSAPTPAPVSAPTPAPVSAPTSAGSMVTSSAWGMILILGMFA